MFFVRDGHLHAQKLNLETLTTESEPSLVAENIASNPGNGKAAFGVSESGVLVYKTGELGGRIQARALWYDRSGRETDAGFPIGFYGASSAPRLSPNGTFALGHSALETGFTEIHMMDLSRRIVQRLTRDYLRDESAVWSPDGKQIIFSSNRSGVYNLFTMGSTGENERSLFESLVDKFPQDWSKDSQNILFQTVGEEGVGDIWLYSFRDGTAKPLVETPFNEADARFSPNGKWFTYTSGNAVWIEPFPPDGRKWPVSTVNGTQAQWNPDGTEIFYRVARQLYSVKVQLTTDFHASEPEPLFSFSGVYAAAPDGKRFLVIRPETVIKEQVMLILNWRP